MPDDIKDLGKNLATSDPFMQIGLSIAKVGQMVQDADLPKSVKDAYETIKSHLSTGSQAVQDAYKTLSKHIMQSTAGIAHGEELTPQGPNEPTPTSQTAAPKSRTLSEAEYNGIREQVLKDAPNGLDEAGFNRYIAYALPQALGTAENMPPKPEGSAAERFLGNAAQLVTGPYQFAKGMVTQPLATLGEVAASHMSEYRKAKQAEAEGRTAEMVGHSVAAAIPVVGPMAAHAGEQMAQGDIAGGLGTATAALAPFGYDAVKSARARTGIFDNPVARAKAGDLVRREAEQQVAQQVLAPGNPRYRGIAQALAPEILRRGLTGGRLELQQLAEAGMHDAGTALDAAIESAGGPKAPVSVDTVAARLRQRVADLTVDGKPIVGAEGRVAALQARIKQLTDMSGPKQSGVLNATGYREVYGEPAAQFDQLRKFRDEQYRQAEEAGGYQRAGNQPMADDAWAAREAGSAVREAFAERSPQAAKANAEYAFWRSLDKVLDPAIGRPKASAPPSGVTGGAATAGAAAGALAGPKAAFVLSVVKPWLAKVTSEPSWQLASAAKKMQLAKAIETGNQGLARTLMLNWGKYGPKDSAEEGQ